MTNATRKSDREKNKMEFFHNKAHQTTENGPSETAKQRTLLIPKKSEPLHCRNQAFTHYAPSPVMTAKECVFEVATTTIPLLSKSTYRITLKICINTLHIHPHTCLLAIVAGLNLVIKAFLTRKWLSNISKQQLAHLQTAIKNTILLGGFILLFVQLGIYVIESGFVCKLGS